MLLLVSCYTHRVKDLHQTYHIKAPVAKVWDALVNPKVIEKWSGSRAVMDANVGSKFSLWDGDIKGTNIKVVAERELAQDWFGGKWDESSQVVFLLSEKDGVTTVELKQENIPDSEAADIADGWKSYYIGPLTDLLEE